MLCRCADVVGVCRSSSLSHAAASPMKLERRRRSQLAYFLVFSLLAISALSAKTCAASNVGTLLKSFPFHATDLVSDSSQPYVYASISGSSSIAVINTQTLSVEKMIALPGTPENASLSADGSTLYVADSTNKSIDCIDTRSLSLTKSLSVSTTPYDVVSGLGNRLFVLDASTTYCHIVQIDATTGASTGNAINSAHYYGTLAISPDRKTLYYGETGISPSRLISYDVSTTNAAVLKTVQPGSNGQLLVLSHDGDTIALPCGAPYAVTLYRASDFTALGTFNTGAYPNAIAFSPDDQIAYVSHSMYPTAVDIYSTKTFELLGQFNVADRSWAMATDASGQELFVSCSGTYYKNSNLIVYQAVPEPSSLAIFGIGAMFAILGCLWRRSRRSA
jgi:DNA-binding beta-propeller fold protein YncE